MNKNEFDFVNAFPPLGHPEHHFNKYPNHKWIKNKEELKKWVLENVEVGSYEPNSIKEDDFYIDDNLYFNYRVNYINSGHVADSDKGKSAIVINKSIGGNLPLQFLQVNEFIASNIGLTTMVGTPFIISCLNVENNRLKDFSGLSERLDYRLTIFNNPLSSFKGMPIFKNNQKLHLFMNGDYFFNKKEQFILREKEPKITSWNYFTNVKSIMFWQSKWCEKTTYDLIINIPESVDVFYATSKLLTNNKGISWINNKVGIIQKLDMD